MESRGGLVVWLQCAGVVGLGLGGCRAQQAPAHAQNPDVATLTGYVAEVDGRPIASLGHALELTPGCHVVATPEEWGDVSISGSLTVKTGKVLFALPMRAGHHYSVDTSVLQLGTESGTVVLEASERDAAGNQNRVFKPARKQSDLDCSAADVR